MLANCSQVESLLADLQIEYTFNSKYDMIILPATVPWAVCPDNRATLDIIKLLMWSQGWTNRVSSLDYDGITCYIYISLAESQT